MRVDFKVLCGHLEAEDLDKKQEGVAHPDSRGVVSMVWAGSNVASEI